MTLATARDRRSTLHRVFRRGGEARMHHAHARARTPRRRSVREARRQLRVLALINSYNDSCYNRILPLGDMDVYTLLPAPEVAKDLAKRLKARRLERNLTQAGLAARSGVPLGTLKKFERTGAISLVSFVRLVVALGEQAGLERLMKADERDVATLDRMLSQPKARKRGRIT